MIENVLRNLGGVGVYGIISVCLFFAFFAGMLVWASRLKRGYLRSMENLPLDDETADVVAADAVAADVKRNPRRDPKGDRLRLRLCLRLRSSSPPVDLGNHPPQ